MPNRCYECDLASGLNCLSTGGELGRDIPKMTFIKRRPDWCPIICVLPEKHGTLIDRETAAEGLSEKYNSCHMTCGAVMQFIDGLPTIVPATEGGKE